MTAVPPFFIFFFFNDTATTEIYTLSLHDALPISAVHRFHQLVSGERLREVVVGAEVHAAACAGAVVERREEDERNFGKRSEEHTSELQSRLHLVCRLLLEKKKKTTLRIRPSVRPA